MGNFNQRRDEYFNKLKLNLDVVEKLSHYKDENDKKIAEILLMPTSERELEFADLCFDFLLNVTALIESVEYDDEKEVDLSNCLIIKILVEVINALKKENTKKIDQYKCSIEGIEIPEVGAKLYYDYLIIYTTKYHVDAINKIMIETGFDPNDELALFQFEIYLGKACEIANENNNKNFDIKNQNQFEYYIRFFKKFNELCNLDKQNQNTEINKKR